MSKKQIKYVEAFKTDTVQLKPFARVSGDQVQFGVTTEAGQDAVFAVLDAEGLHRVWFPDWVGLPLDRNGMILLAS